MIKFSVFKGDDVIEKIDIIQGPLKISDIKSLLSKVEFIKCTVYAIYDDSASSLASLRKINHEHIVFNSDSINHEPLYVHNFMNSINIADSSRIECVRKGAVMPVVKASLIKFDDIEKHSLFLSVGNKWKYKYPKSTSIIDEVEIT